MIRIDNRTGRFPDASVTCRRTGGHAIADPVAVFEILSPSTELLDRTDRRGDYQRLSSLRHYVLIAQDTARVEIYTRGEAGWRFQELDDPDGAVPLDTLGIDLPLVEIDEGVPLESESAAATAP